MYTAKIENKNGEVYVLTGVEPVYQVIDIVGLNPPNAQVNTTGSAGQDGAVFNSSKLQTREIVLAVKINGEVEKNRLNLYNYFRTKEWCRFYYSNDSRDVYIDGYVQSVECGLFSNSEQAQISILCPMPYFQAMEEIIDDLSSTVSAFVFPFSINVGEPIAFSLLSVDSTAIVMNASESETGLEIQVDIENTVSEITIQNVQTGEALTVDYSFVADDRLLINTNRGSKSIRLIRDGVTSNLFSALKKGSVFFQLQAGENEFGYSVDDGAGNADVNILFRHRTAYRGV